MGYVSAALTILCGIASPFIYTLKIITSLLLLTVITPILRLGHSFAYAFWYPLYMLRKFETLFVFLGVALIVGALTGTSLHYISDFTISILHLKADPQQEERGRSLAKYRANKRELKEQDAPLRKLIRKNKITPQDDGVLLNELKDWEWLAKEERGRPRNGLIPNTILEEEDSSEGGF
ncbi:MAG: hypothetical protein Q9217_002340 [Psora testacea]